MKRIPSSLDPTALPESLRSFIRSAAVYDSSCSPDARVYFLDQGEGFYLKTAPKGSLQQEASLGQFFHSKGLGAEVLAYESRDADWLLTRRISGEDCTHPMYLSDPVRLCDTLGQRLRMLHDTDTSGYDLPVRTTEAVRLAKERHAAGHFNPCFFDTTPCLDPDEAWRTVLEGVALLQSDTLIHGDYCLPNILLDGWRFSGFIDLGAAGMGDRHMDLFWGIWSLRYNLKIDRFRDRFLDAYGRDRVCPELLRTVAALEAFG